MTYILYTYSIIAVIIFVLCKMRNHETSMIYRNSVDIGKEIKSENKYITFIIKYINIIIKAINGILDGMINNQREYIENSAQTENEPNINQIIESLKKSEIIEQSNTINIKEEKPNKIKINKSIFVKPKIKNTQIDTIEDIIDKKSMTIEKTGNKIKISYNKN